MAILSFTFNFKFQNWYQEFFFLNYPATLSTSDTFSNLTSLTLNYPHLLTFEKKIKILNFFLKTSFQHETKRGNIISQKKFQPNEIFLGLNFSLGNIYVTELRTWKLQQIKNNWWISNVFLNLFNPSEVHVQQSAVFIFILLWLNLDCSF